MAAIRYLLIFVLALACVMADETYRAKKDVVLNYGAYPYPYSSVYGAYPYTAGVLPYSAYTGSYPYGFRSIIY